METEMASARALHYHSNRDLNSSSSPNLNLNPNPNHPLVLRLCRKRLSLRPQPLLTVEEENTESDHAAGRRTGMGCDPS